MPNNNSNEKVLSVKKMKVGLKIDPLTCINDFNGIWDSRSNLCIVDVKIIKKINKDGKIDVYKEFER